MINEFPTVHVCLKDSSKRDHKYLSATSISRAACAHCDSQVTVGINVPLTRRETSRRSASVAGWRQYWNAAILSLQLSLRQAGLRPVPPFGIAALYIRFIQNSKLDPTHVLILRERGNDVKGAEICEGELDSFPLHNPNGNLEKI